MHCEKGEVGFNATISSSYYTHTPTPVYGIMFNWLRKERQHLNYDIKSLQSREATSFIKTDLILLNFMQYHRFFTKQSWLLKWQLCIRKNSLTHLIFTHLQITVIAAYPSPSHTLPFQAGSEKFLHTASLIVMPRSYEHMWETRKCSFLTNISAICFF